MGTGAPCLTTFDPESEKMGRLGRKQRKIRRTCVKTQQVDIYYKFIGLINQKAEGGYKGEVVKVKRTEIENQPA